MRFRLSTTILIAILLATAGQAWADGSQAGSVGGVVKNAEAGPLPGVLVTVTGVTAPLRTTITVAVPFCVRSALVGTSQLSAAAVSAFASVATAFIPGLTLARSSPVSRTVTG